MQQATTNESKPFIFVDRFPLVTVKVNGENKQFILDNGAPTFVLNSRHYNDKGTPLQAFSSAGGTKNIQSKFITVFEWDALRLENQLALIMDLSHYEKNANTIIHGIIGASILKNYDLQLDYGNRQVSLLSLIDRHDDPLDKTSPSLISRYQTIPIQMIHHFPIIRLQIGEKALNMVLNMGARVNTISQNHMEYCKQLGLLVDETPSTILGLATEKQAIAYPIDSIIAGTLEDIFFKNMLFAFDSFEIPGAAIDGMLGYEFFSRATVIIRYNRRELLFNI